MIFDLIKSLNIAEKRYFKIFTTQHVLREKNDYITLFDIINESKSRGEYEERLKYIDLNIRKNISKNKNFLVAKILQALAVFNANANPQIKLWQLLAMSRILLNKRQNKLVIQYLKKTKKLAHFMEDYGVLYTVNQFEKERVIDVDSNIMKKLEHNDLDILSAMSKKSMLYLINAKISTIIAKNQRLVRSRNDINRLKNIISEIEKVTISDEDSFSIKGYYLNIWANYYCGLGKLDKENVYRNKLIKLHEQHPKINQIKIISYISTLSNLAMNQLDLNQYLTCEASIKKLKNIPQLYVLNNEGIKILELQILVLESSWIIATGNISFADTVLLQIKAKLNSNINSFYKIALSFDMAVIYFIKEDFNTSLDFLNDVLNDEKLNESLEVQYLARILNIILHFELGNMQLLDSLIKSTYRYLLKRQKLYQFEKHIIRFIKNSLKVEPGENYVILFKALKKDLELVTQDLFESRVLHHFDLIAWLESKIRNIPMAVVLQNNAIQNN